MAIDKKFINGGRKRLTETPVHCPEHQAGPDPECGHREHFGPAPEIKLYDSFEEAVIAASKVFLRPGEARTEFYKDGSLYHCVLALGNINAAKGHIVLTDTGNEKPSHEQYAYLKELIDINSNILSETVVTVNAKLAAFDASMGAMRTEMDTFMTSINYIVNEFREDISGDMDDIRTWVDASLGNFRSEISAWSASLQGQMDSLRNDVSARMAAHEVRVDAEIAGVISDTSVKLDALDGKIGGTAAGLNARIAEVSANLGSEASRLDGRIDSVISNTSVMNVSLGARIDGTVVLIDSRIADVSDAFDDRLIDLRVDMETADTALGVRIDGIETDVDSRISAASNVLNARIDSVISNTSTLNDALNARIDAHIEDCSARCASLGERIETVDLESRERDSEISADVSARHDGINQRIDGVLQVIDMKDASNLLKFNDLYDHLGETDASVVSLREYQGIQDASIMDLFCLVSEPIVDPSILSLFDKDIYTVNLCCYTEGGYITIRDEKEPVGQYKTYVTGDRVEFTAVPNIGYKFKKWTRNAVDYTTDTSIGLSFSGKDINVNGLLPTDDIAILKDGYSAIFAALYTVTTHCIVETNHAEMFNDNIQVRGAIQGKWFDDGMEIELIANPQQHHDFKRFVINGTQSLLPDVRLTPNANIDAYAYFSERRYTIVGESHDLLQGDVTYTYRDEAGNPYSGMVENEVIEGTKVTLTAAPVQGYRFLKWTYGQGEAKYGEIYDDQHASVTIVASATCVKRLEAWFEADV